MLDHDRSDSNVDNTPYPTKPKARARARRMFQQQQARSIPQENGQLSQCTTEFPVIRVKLVRETSGTEISATIASAKEAAAVFRQHMGEEDREHVAVLLLDAKNGLLGVHTVSVGSLTMSLVTAREVFKAAILANSASIIVGHNHPSGDPSPSPEDITVTRMLVRSGSLLDIPVLDHIIVGSGSTYCSLQELGHIAQHTQNCPVLGL